jgi:uncharacterized sporulation protein YeaH/YhbH (DUF444 family)
MTIFIDRRKTDKGKNLGNKQRFLQRIAKAIKAKAHRVVGKSMGNEKSEGKVTVDHASVEEPTFVYGSAEQYNLIFPGNRKYVRGDIFDTNDMGEGSGSGSGDGQGEGDGEDDFTINVSREDFLNYFFEDLELPNLDKLFGDDVKIEQFSKGGYTSDGPPSRLAIVKTIMQAKMRRIAMQAPFKKKLKELEQELEHAFDMEQEEILRKQIKSLKIKMHAVTFIEPLTDLRYRTSIPKFKKNASAAIIFIMDNSGSMGQFEKELSRKFFTLFYLFVDRKYKDVKLYFITHTDTAKVVDEETFFNSRENGGTKVSTAYVAANKIIDTELDSEKTNIYVVQASDGDNSSYDSPECTTQLAKIIPRVQFFTYMQIEDNAVRSFFDRYLWDCLEAISLNAYSKGKFALAKLHNSDEIYTTFSTIFRKK